MAVAYKDYYKVLAVPRGAAQSEIAKAYKKLARKHHPDLNQGDAAAEEKFKDINEAYEVLKDPEKRRLYDQLGPHWQDGQNFQGAPGFEHMRFNFGGQSGQGGQAGRGFGGGDFSDFFETLFGGSRQGAQGFGPDPFGSFSRSRRGRDVEAELPISLEEAYKGGEKTFTLGGSDGRTLRVNVPAGIRDGGKMRLSGQGRPGDPAGDLFLTVRYEAHPSFEVEGDNIVCDVEVSPWDAVLGARVRVPTLEGAVEMNIPAGSGSGRKLRLRGKGLGPVSARGDEMVRVAIRTPQPAELSPRQRELWEELAAESR